MRKFVFLLSAVRKARGTKTPEAGRLWFRHLAHEAFHFWDGQMFRADEENEWLSEAAAEYASFLALRDRGLVDDAQLERALVEQCNGCLAREGVGKFALDSREAGRECGATISVAGPR